MFEIKTHPGTKREGTCRDDRDLLQHFLRPAAKKMGVYYQGFGFRALRREAITEIGSVAGMGEAMKAGGHTHLDTTMLYTPQDRTRLENTIKNCQEPILGKVNGLVQ